MPPSRPYQYAHRTGRFLILQNGKVPAFLEMRPRMMGGNGAMRPLGIKDLDGKPVLADRSPVEAFLADKYGLGGDPSGLSDML